MILSEACVLKQRKVEREKITTTSSCSAVAVETAIRLEKKCNHHNEQIIAVERRPAARELSC